MITYDLDDLRHLQLLELKILKEVISICEKHDLKYYAFGGTELGAIRHGGFIPWDNDVDIAMFREDYEKLLKIFDSELGDEYYVIHPNNQEDCYFSIARVYLKGTKFHHYDPLDVSFEEGIKIDIFPLDHIPDSKIKRIIYYYEIKFYDHLLKNALFKINTPNKLSSAIHSLLHNILKLIPVSVIKRRFLKCQTKYNNKETKYISFHDSLLGFLKVYYTKQDFEPSKKFKFEDIEINMPNNYEKMLILWYGDYMALPPEEERYIYDEIVDFGEYKDKL